MESIKTTKTALFLPSYLGGGFGHIARCIALAQAFDRRGGRSIFAMNGPHLKAVAEAGFNVHVLSIPTVVQGQASGPAYIYVPGMAYQIVRDGFDNQSRVKGALNELVKIIEKTMPDILISDGYPITWMAGKKTGIPVVQFVKSVVHPMAKRMVWWEEDPQGMIVPDVRPVFNPVLEHLGLPQITRGAEELLQGDLLIIPSIPVLDPMDPVPPNTHYVGPIVRSNDGTRSMPEWFSSLSNDKPVVFVTVGGAAGHGGSSQFFDVVLEAFRDSNFQIVVSTGGKIDPEVFGSVPDHIRMVRWVPGTEMIARSDLVVFHGGYTRMEVLMQGLPSVVIPFHSEQEYYGRVMEKAGVAVVVHYSNEPYQRFLRHWKGGNRWMKSNDFTIHVRPRITMQPEALRAAINQCLNNETIKLRTQTLQKELASYEVCDKAIDLIKSRLP